MKFKRLLCAVSALAVIGSASLPSGGSLTDMFSVSASAATKLSAPENVTASVSGDKITLEWDAVDGAARYMVYQYNSSTKKYEELKRVKSCKAVISGLDEGSYTFKVAAGEKSGKAYKFGKLSEKVKVKLKHLTSVELAKELGKGWNLGNTMEATGTWFTPTVENFESCWGAPKTSFEMMKGIKEAGFNTVRVPVAWSNLMSKDGKYTISSELFDRIDEIVGYVLDNDMYCILNIHWDGGWWDGLYSKDEKVKTETMKKYKTMWKQISKHYAGYSEKLIFESANEELGGGDAAKKLGKNKAYEIVNKTNQTFVDIVRASGKNNKTRYLLIAGYNTSIDDTTNDKYVMPTDTVKDHLLISVHYYDPPVYCLVEDKNNSWGYSERWGTNADIEAMKAQLGKMTKFTKAGYGVIIGEYGVAHRKEIENGKETYYVKEGTDLFYKSMLEFSKQYGFCPVLWDTPGNWYDRENQKFFNDEIAAVFEG